MGQQQSFPDLEEEFGVRVPFYPYPEEAVRCLERMARYAELSVRSEGRPFGDAIDVETIRTVLSSARAAGRGELCLSESLRLVEAAGLAVAPWRWVPAGEGAAARLAVAGESLGYPVVVKADVAAHVHKAGRGLVALDLREEAALIAAAQGMESALSDPETGAMGWVVQSLAASGFEMLFGMVSDPVFGPVLALGLGGTQVDGIRDVVFRLNPVTDVIARAMVEGLRGQALLDGLHGGPAVDREALMRALGKLSRLIEEIEDLEELDLNPVVFGPASPAGLVLDARVRLRGIPVR
jgi:acetyltransferase